MVKVKRYVTFSVILIFSAFLTISEIYICKNPSIFLPLTYLLIIICINGGIKKITQPIIALLTIVSYLACFYLLISFKIESTKIIVGLVTLFQLLL